MQAIGQRVRLGTLTGLLIGMTFLIPKTNTSAYQDTPSDTPSNSTAPSTANPQHWDWGQLPRGLASPPKTPNETPLTKAQVALGRRLFFDKGLSRDQTIACVSCHQPNMAMATNDRVAIGVEAKQGTRNSPSLLNVGYRTTLFWDGRASSLEEQALQPIENPLEMDFSVDEVVNRLQANASYVAAFQAAFDSEPSRESLAAALAAFQRTLIAGDSPVDRFREGDFSALTAPQRNGMWLFESRAGCWRCHSGPNFTDDRFHNTGVAWASEPRDLGRFLVTGEEADRGAFKTPGLRSVSRTAPYMHDGSMATLADVVRFYNEGGIKNAHLDEVIKPLNLTDEEQRFLVAFLEALDSELPTTAAAATQPDAPRPSAEDTQGDVRK